MDRILDGYIMVAWAGSPMKYWLKANPRRNNTCWENTSKINNDFVPLVAHENFDNEPMDQWLRIVKMFMLELSSRKTSIQLSLHNGFQSDDDNLL